LPHWFPELKNDTDKRKHAITLREVMNQASGLYHEDLESPTGVSHFLARPGAGEYVLRTADLIRIGSLLLQEGRLTESTSFLPAGWYRLTKSFKVI
jgi:hypothetical protein